MSIAKTTTTFLVAGGLTLVGPAAEGVKSIIFEWLAPLESNYAAALEVPRDWMAPVGYDMIAVSSATATLIASDVNAVNMVSGDVYKGYLAPHYYGLGGAITDVSSGTTLKSSDLG